MVLKVDGRSSTSTHETHVKDFVYGDENGGGTKRVIEMAKSKVGQRKDWRRAAARREGERERERDCVREIV